MLRALTRHLRADLADERQAIRTYAGRQQTHPALEPMYRHLEGDEREHAATLQRALKGTTMPAVSKAQQRLMGAAEHGAEFPAAKKIRESMTHEQMHDFAKGSMKGKPEHVSKAHLHGHAAKRGHGGMRAEAYVHGAMMERAGAHKDGHPRTSASGHGYSGDTAQAYMDGAQHEADGEHDDEMEMASVDNPDEESAEA